MTISKKEQAARDSKQMEMITSKLYMSLSFNDWKQAAELGITRESVEGNEIEQSIMLAAKQTGKNIYELTDLGLDDLNKMIFGEELWERTIATVNAA